MLTKKKKLRPLNKLLKDAEKVFNAFIRRRDSEDGFFKCISCGKVKPIDKMNAGHYVPVGQCSFLRFDVWNTNGECEGCNCFDKFHLVGYRKNLIEKIGLENVEWLDSNARGGPYKHTRQTLETIIKKYAP